MNGRKRHKQRPEWNEHHDEARPDQAVELDVVGVLPEGGGLHVVVGVAGHVRDEDSTELKPSRGKIIYYLRALKKLFSVFVAADAFYIGLPCRASNQLFSRA